MNTPPLLLAAAILLWGWLGDTLAVAVPVAFVLEGARLAKGRVELTTAQQFRVADLSTLLAIAAGLAFAASAGFPRAAVLFFQWLPVALLPLALMQAWGAEREIDLRVLFWSMRRQALREPARLNLGHPYLALWIVAASAAPGRGPAFDAGLAVLVAWALWSVRPDRRRTAAWAGLVTIAGSLGYVGAIGLHDLQLWLEGAAPEWLGGGGTKVSPYRGVTDIGRLGELKMSDAIVLRVEAEASLKTPLLLHQASYVEYEGTNWIARGGTFAAVPAGPGGPWRLGEGEAERYITIQERAAGGDPVLSLPPGAVVVSGAGLRSLKANPLGAVQAAADPGFVEYRIGIDPRAADRRSPTPVDLRLPQREKAMIERVARAWGLAGLAPAAAVEAVRSRFVSGFRYSTFQEMAAAGRTPLADFLERTQAGHCEHFATATTLLLRAAGVPARYASGYSLQEWSDFERAWIARERHSHAWSQAWVDGRWVDVDSTPPSWFELEGGERPAWSAIADAWSWMRFRLDRWHRGAGATERALAWGAPALLLVAFFLWRMGRRWRPASRAAAAIGQARGEGDYAGSEFARVATRLEAMGHARRPGETSRDWIARLGPAAGDPGAMAALLALHYRHRFDPRGLTALEKSEFSAATDRWLEAASGGRRWHAS